MADAEDTAPAAPRRKTLDELMQFARDKAAKATATAEQKAAETPRQLWLPGFDIGAMPSHINRSSLFAPVARGRRKFHRQAAMVTRSDCVLEYTGEQLDEADADLVMALIFFAQKQPLGKPVPLQRSQLLRKIGRSTGKHDYDWLHRRIKALTEATLFLEAKKPDGSTRYSIGKTVSFRIVSGFVYDDETESYTYTLDPRWVQMFSNREYSLIDFERRLMIGRGQDMAKALQRLVATSADPVQRYALDWLKSKLEYSGRMRDFRDALMRACAELERLNIIARARIEQSTRARAQLAVWLPASG
jgi:hypothetical protein